MSERNMSEAAVELLVAARRFVTAALADGEVEFAQAVSGASEISIAVQLRPDCLIGIGAAAQDGHIQRTYPLRPPAGEVN